MPIPTAVSIELTDEERALLESFTRRHTSAQALALRARIVLDAADGFTNGEIAERQRVSRPTVTKWRGRFAEFRVDGLLDEPRPGRPRTITDEQVEAVVVKTLESTPKNATELALGASPERHRVDHEVAEVSPDHDQLEKVAGAVWAHHEVARRIVPELDPHDGLS
jgi:transposase